jgi:hypothetical protein
MGVGEPTYYYPGPLLELKRVWVCLFVESLGYN